MSSLDRVIAALLWTAVLAIAWVVYAPALSGVFLLDDIPNLSGLAAVSDAGSALHFVFSGESGFLGRPLALATFLPHADAWQRSAEPFLRVNVLIHLANASLVWCVLYQLLKGRGDRVQERALISGSAAALWLLMPLLASASLMIIQRMTTLSATFVLLGMAGYLLARNTVERRPGRALAGMSSALVLGTLLSVLVKENGALLPTYVLVIELTLFSAPQNIDARHWRLWKSVFLVAPTVFLLAFVAWQVPYPEEVVLKREFTAWERLLTESRILWGYLLNAFIPRPGAFGPFHDTYAVARSIFDPVTLAACAGWLTASVLAGLWRRRFPLLAFATLWFLAGHLLESTVISLDLYFEHRNYLPVIGPVFALCASLMHVPAGRRRLAYTGLATWGAASALVLFNLTSLWGNPALAFAYWQEKSPRSVYAATAAMAYVQATQGPEATIRMIDDFVTRVPDTAYLNIHRLKLACVLEPERSKARAVDDLKDALGRVSFSFSAVTMLSQLADQVSTSPCRGVDMEAVRGIARALRMNARYRNNAGHGKLHHQFMALTYQYEGDHAAVLEHLKIAIQFKHTADLNRMMVLALTALERFDDARTFLGVARAGAPLNPFKRYVWLHELEQLDEHIELLESHLSPGV